MAGIAHILAGIAAELPTGEKEGRLVGLEENR
ncbi:hypothetical protein PAECIP111893_03092 [Paenibacillus plantiphilus]|uniref:Uncharacterized protein n=1 Tax=Paenibacillus plantiphilus TaxID=2905650 RepID=A0ABM9CDH1_9BACL|nr:hypothetical protein PAECIP111893_03092 [Paenibacillus plantiphilus]